MALKCDAISPDALPRLPLFPGKRQEWLLVVRLSPEEAADPERLENAVRGLFQEWLPLFPGPIGEPEILEAEESPTTSVAQPPALGFRDPSSLVGVAFDYGGTATEMRWPTYVARRRERIDPLCPMAPTDAMPIGIGAPTRDNDGEDALSPKENLNEDPWDIGVGPIDPGRLRLAIGGTALLAGIGVGLVLVWATRKRS